METLKQNLNSYDINYKPGDFKIEIHFFGQIVGASNVNETSGLFCDCYFDSGPSWKILSPPQIYQTQTGYADVSGFIAFSHPFDLHYSSNNLYGWPRIVCRLWKLDNASKIDLLAYGCSVLPNEAGFHKCEFNTWILQGDLKTETLGYFLETKPKMNSTDPVSVNLHERKELVTKPGPKIHFNVEILLKSFFFHSVSGQI